MKASKLAVLTAIVVTTSTPAHAQPVIPSLFGNSGFNQERAREPRKDTLEDLFPRSELKEVTLSPLNLKPGKMLPGLNAPQVEKLNAGYFVVVDDARVTNFATIYKQNRIDGLPNFVSADCLLHPFLAHRNAIKVAVINKYIIPQLKSLLEGMIGVSLTDYQETDDEEVKVDIQRNLAFLSVALRLLSPEDKPKELGPVEELVRQDLESIQKEKLAPCASFKRNENFALYRPFGWYQSSNGLENFFRCRQWLGRMFLALTDVTNNTSTGSGNEFRRAVLLYRSLIRAKLAGGEGFSTWAKVNQALELMEDSEPSQTSGDLLPEDFATAFLATEKNLKLTLGALSNPLTRTKLLLSLKGAGSKQFSSTSIFELNSKNQKEGRNLVFRLLPPVNPPEIDWVNEQIVQEKDATTGFNALPVSLIFLHARGFHLANNILADNTWRLDPDLIYSIPRLEKLVSRASENPSNRSIWQILSSYAKAMPDGAQSPLRTNLWLTCCQETTIASWVDNWLALDKQGSGNAAAAAATNPTVRKMSSFNYLEPVPEIFKRMSAGLLQFAQGLVELGFFPTELKERTADFHRLADRLADIATKELANQPIGRDDVQLLANIDRLLDKISPPVPGSIFVSYGIPRPGSGAAPNTVPTKPDVQLISRSAKNASAKGSTAAPAISEFKGINLGLGGPGVIYIVLKTARGLVLCRGGVYSYYETPGDALSAAHWQRRLDYGLIKPPFWCDPFQMVDESTTKH